MPAFKTKTSIGNVGGKLSKDYGMVIPEGAVLKYADEKVPDRVKQLQKIGVIVEADKDDQSDENEGSGHDDQEPGEPDPQPLPDDRDELKAIADGLEITYAQNIGTEKLKERIKEARGE